MATEKRENWFEVVVMLAILLLGVIAQWSHKTSVDIQKIKAEWSTNTNQIQFQWHNQHGQ